MATLRGIPLSKVSPAFLHANSTSHTWVFSAFAELIDNAYDPDVSASELLIDKIDIHGVPCLIFLDNGAGMDTDHLLKMLSFGFCEKAVYEKQGSHQPIGHYGNGFKSGSMRIGQDALVFTRCHKSASIGFLSQTYLTAVQTDSVVVPILEYRLPSLERIKSQESRNNLNAILEFSVFKMEDELKEELKALEGSKTGTKIIISNLKRLQDRTYELDFASDPRDIRCPEAHEVDMTSVYHRPIQHNTSEYKRSLREYCSILFLRPRMKITIRGSRVKSRLISKSLSSTEIDMYKPTWLSRPVKIIFGFKCEKGRPEDYDYGMMLYHRNRLIKAFEKVGYQKQPNGLGVGVVGVAQVDFLQPIHNKQDFNKDEKFNSVMAAFCNKLNDYWNEKKGSNGLSLAQPVRNLPDWLWAQCDHCLKWRRLPDEIDPESLPDLWYCRLNPDATHNRCDIPEEPEDEDLASKPTYEKTFKKKQEERKRLQQIEREREEDFKRRKIIEKERELKQKEATLKAIQQVATAQPDNRTVTSLQKALAEVRRKEEQQKRLILQIQEQKKLMEEQRNSLLQMAENLQTADKDQSKDVLKQMSKLIGTFSSLSPGLPSKRKLSEEIQTTPNAKSRKKICIKTETGEMLSIIQNDIDSDDNEDVDTNHSKSASSPHKQSNGNVLPVKSEAVKNTSTVSPSRSLLVNPPTENNPTNSSTKRDKKPGPTNQQLPQRTEHTAQASSPTKPRRKQKKGTVMAVIDLTSESEFGELVDIKPDLEGLRDAVQENLQQGHEDIKPDKDVLDEVISQTGDSNKQKATVQPLDEAKQEIVETSVQSSTAASSKKASENEEIKEVKEDDKISFGPSEDDPEFPMGIPEHFQENLEAAMAAIQERMEREKLEQESRDDHPPTEANVPISESNDELKIENVGATSSLKQQNNLDSSLEGTLRDSYNSRAGEAQTEKKDDTDERENEDASADFSFKDVMILSGDDEDNSDCDGPAEDDSDYRDYSALYEKGDSSDPHNGSKQCDKMGESRINSIENGGGSSNQGISDDGGSVPPENVESPDGKSDEIDRPGETNESLSEGQNSMECSGSKVECELQNRLDRDSSESLANVMENLKSASLDGLTNVKDSSSKLSCGQKQMSVAQTSFDEEESHDSIVGPALNVCEDYSEPIVQDVEGSTCDQQSGDPVITESSPSHAVTVHENSMHTENNVCESENSLDSEHNFCENEDSVGNEQNLCENEDSVDNEQNFYESESSLDNEESVCENKDSVDNEKSVCENKDSVDNEKSVCENKDSADNEQSVYENKDSVDNEQSVYENKDSVDNERSMCENKDSMDNEQNFCESMDLVPEQVSSLEETSIRFRGKSPCERFTSKNDSKSQCNSSSTLQPSLYSDEPILSLSPHKNVQSPCHVSVAVEPSSVSGEMLQDNVINEENNDNSVLKCKEQLEQVLSEHEFDKRLNKHCDLNRTCDQGMQTDLDMSAISEVLKQREDLDVSGLCGTNGFHLNIKRFSDVAKVDKSFQTSDCEQTSSTAESQTEVTELRNGGSIEEETRERLQKELSLKSQNFEEMERKLSEINGNIYKLLGFLSPETELGDVNNIDQIIIDMIKVHVDPCQQPEPEDQLSHS